jgi:molybdopterin-containing oxidoreductase family iron-sulfur binding subunit
MAAAAAAPAAATVVVGSGNDPAEADQADAARTGAIADHVWKRALSDGLVANSAAAPLPLPAAMLHAFAPTAAPSGHILSLSHDPTVFDGAYAENAWLQECPKPITSEVWGAGLAVSPNDAKALGVKDFDHVRLTRGGHSVQASVRVVAGQADGVVSSFIGGGRTQAGAVGSHAGYDFAPLRSLVSPWLSPVTLEKTPGKGGPPAFQSLYTLEGDAKKLSPLITVRDLAKLKSRPIDATETPPTLLPAAPAYEPSWAMVIDQASCIGCNACVVSCQSENNIPVVGPVEIARGRDMHWLRIDTYDVGDEDEPRPAFQPVPCMQCEHAPCEPVCPVEASIHDHEGLNNQVYNRCIGTRFCQSNCPYKVRRFNWYDYADTQAYAGMGDAAYEGQKNPEVTVRTRGVMEKCTYCVQRISGARRLAERENREIGPHEVVTACQSACPTQAISFGDKSNPASGMEALREDPRHFALLEEEGTRPRTTYLARLRNANPALGSKA